MANLATTCESLHMYYVYHWAQVHSNSDNNASNWFTELSITSIPLFSLSLCSYEEALQTLADSEAKRETVDKELRLVSDDER